MTVKKSFLPYKWELVALLWLAFFFNQADRQIFNIVLPLIRDDLNLTDADMGLIASVFTLIYGLLVPVAGLLGDKINKKYIIITALLFWSVATLCTGFCSGLVGLMILRSAATGGGEAFYAPSANSIISENHETSTRATALSIHQTALYVGIIVSGYMVGALAEKYGWRETFYLFGGLGIILGTVLIFRIKKSKTVVAATEIASKSSVKEGVLVFFKTPSAVLLALAFAFMQFVGVGFLVWMPTFLHETFDFSLARSGFDATFYTHVAAFIGVLAGAKITDRLTQKFLPIRALIQMIGLLIGVPFLILMAKSHSIISVYIALFFFGISRGMYDSNIFASLYDVIEEKFRATATGFMLMFAFVVGSTSPYLLGVLKPALGLSNGIASLSVIYFLSAFIILIAMLFTLKKDHQKLISST